MYGICLRVLEGNGEVWSCVEDVLYVNSRAIICLTTHRSLIIKPNCIKYAVVLYTS